MRNNLLKRIIALAMALIVSLSVASLAEAVHDPLEDKLPLRLIFEEVGFIVAWNEEDASIHITYPDEDIDIRFFVERNIGVVNGNEFELRYGIILLSGMSFITWHDYLYLNLAFMGAEQITFTLTEEARELALYDFDFVINAILENTPWNSVIYRNLGFDFEELTSGVREYIYYMRPVRLFTHYTLFPVREETDARSIAANYLSHLLFWELTMPLEGIGHLMPRDIETYLMQLEENLRIYHNSENELIRDSVRRWLDIFAHPDVVWFYGEHEFDLASVNAIFPEIPGNVITEIIEPNEIAFMRIYSFMANPSFDALTFQPFFEEIRDFDHLIIDIRGNGGGLMAYFNSYIVSRLISEPLVTTSYEFFSGGHIAVEYFNAMYEFISTVLAEALTEYPEYFYGFENSFYVRILPIDEFLYGRDKTYFNEDDLASLSYVMVSSSVVFPNENYNVGFTGRIWLLVDEDSASASSGAALFSMNTGFATVVGTRTSGVMAASHVYLPLPNIGMLWRIDIGYFTDAQGRSLEAYGIIAQVQNIWGFDALYTTLLMIDLGIY